MSASDSTEGASKGKRKPKPKKGQFSIDPRLLYSQDEVIANLGIAPKTIVEWDERGLDAIMPMDKRKWYLGASLIEFMVAESRKRKAAQ